MWNIYYQKVIKLVVKITTIELSNFKPSFDSLSRKNKNEFLDVVRFSIKDQLSEEVKSNKIFESIVQILNIKIWKHEKVGHYGKTMSDFEFADAHVEYFYKYFNISLG